MDTAANGGSMLRGAAIADETLNPRLGDPSPEEKVYTKVEQEAMYQVLRSHQSKNKTLNGTRSSMP